LLIKIKYINYIVNLYLIIDEGKILIDTIEKYYKIFDNNKYPLIVINNLNDSGYIYLSQIFLGILSPLISIVIYKGRMRITDSFKGQKKLNIMLRLI
jgi:hypothetical protein